MMTAMAKRTAKNNRFILIIIIIIIIINVFLHGAFTKLNAPYNDLQTENKITIPI